MTDTATSRARSRSLRRLLAADLVLLVVLAGISAPLLVNDAGSAPTRALALGAPPRHVGGTTTTAPAPTTTTAPTLPAPAPGFDPGHVTAVGDSVMLDYQGPLETDVPGVAVYAAVSRQWSDGETILSTLKAAGQLGAEVIVALGTNGPISDTDFDNMMSILSGASRVVFVNTHVDRPWQDPNNAVIAAGAARYPNVVVADWATLAAQNPQWFGPDGTHLAIGGPGAVALAALVASDLAPS
jgi:hypothetical protein